jgi:hypothetical protein
MRARNIIMGWVAAAALATLAGCGGAITFTVKGTPKAPELDGKVICDPKSEHGMTTIKIDFEHLAPPARLGSGGHFIVWAKGEKGWMRVGTLKYDEGNRKASIEGASAPLTSFDLMITVEGDMRVEAPSADPFYFVHVN